MPDRPARTRHPGLARIARLRVAVGFVVAAAAFWLAAPTWSSMALGVPVAVLGEALRLWAAGHLRKGRELTSSGPYRFMRHPLYLGSFVMGVGFCAAAADLVVTGLVLGYLVFMFRVAIVLEDGLLRAAFGAEFERYAAGRRTPANRRWTFEQAVRNGEHRTLLGFAGALLLLGIKASLLQS